MRFTGRRSVSIALCLAIMTLGSHELASAYPRPGRNVQVDLSYQGRQPECSLPTCNASSNFPDVSTNGRYVAFQSHASNLVPGDTNVVMDVFVRDLMTKEITRASVASDGTQAVGLNTEGFAVTAVSQDPSMSTSGRYVAFMSIASNLAAGDTNQRNDAFVHDLKTGRTILASPGPDGRPAGISNAPKISGNGRFIVFDAVRDDGIGAGPVLFGSQNVYRFDLKTRKTQLVSRTVDGRPCVGCFAASISGDGRHVSFVSLDSTLVVGDTNASYDLFVKDMKTGETVRASVASDGTEGRQPVESATLGFTIPGAPIMSAGGRFVLFASSFGNLVPSDTNYRGPLDSGDDVFVHDLKTRRTDRVSVSSVGAEVAGAAQHFEDISRDGRFILFGSSSDDLDQEGGTGWDLFVHDRRTGSTTFVRPTDLENYNSCAGNGALGRVGALSPDGRYAVFRGCGQRRPAGQSGTYNLYRRYMGPDLGTGAAPAGVVAVSGAPRFGARGFLAIEDDHNDASALVDHGGELVGSEVALRPRHADLFVRLKLKSMPRGTVGYGARFGVRGIHYEIRGVDRALPSIAGTGDGFHLYRCTATGACDAVSPLAGAFGTTGVEVVFSIPLKYVDLDRGGRIDDLEAFTFGADPARSPIDLVALGGA